MSGATFNDHVVRPIGWLQFYVSSASRIDMVHLCDLEGDEYERGICSCEAYEIQKHRPCRHIRAAIEFIVDGVDGEANQNRLREFLIDYYEGLHVSHILPNRQDSVSEPEQPKRIYKLQAA